MNAYIYRAALVCEDCGDKIKAKLAAEGKIDRMPRQPVTCAPEREDGEDCETYYHRACEEMREYLQGNPPWF